MRTARTLLVLGLGLLVGVSLLAGCGKKPKVVTEAAPPPPVTQTVTEPVAAEPAQPAPAPAVDYANLDPSAYGIEDVFFPYDVYALSEEAMGILERNARIMQEHPAVNYLVEGHCDERGTIEYNMALGEKRAKTARDYLVSLGVSASRLQVVSYGENRPFAPGHDESAWRLNRRAHFARP